MIRKMQPPNKTIRCKDKTIIGKIFLKQAKIESVQAIYSQKQAIILCDMPFLFLNMRRNKTIIGNNKTIRCKVHKCTRIFLQKQHF